MKGKKKNKLLIMFVIVVLAAAGGFIWMNINSGEPVVAVGSTELHPMNLVNSISTKGMVESITKTNVYTTLGYTIKTVNVEVGDRISQGQVLVELDTENLVLDIAQRKADLNVSQQNSLNQLKNNERIYNEALSNLKGGTNSQILNAENALKTATLNLEKAEKDYADAVSDFENNTNSQVITAESNLTTASLDLENKEKTYENNQVLFSIGAISMDALTQSEDAYTSAWNKYNDALTNLENMRTTEKRTVEQAESMLKNAQTAYENAVASRNAAVETSGQELERYLNNIESSKISTNNDSALIAIQKLEKQVEDSIIKSPVQGTITAVYAKEGAAGSGLLFVIEDTEDLKITTKIKEYDIARVKEGMAVEVKSDSTGDTVYDAVISKINPAANKGTNGEINLTSEVEFGAEAMLVSKETDLKIGMETRLTIVLEKKENVYSVPYDSVIMDSDSTGYVYTVGDDMTAQRVDVTTGMETDFYIEITGSLTDGMHILNDAASVQEGMQITLK